MDLIYAIKNNDITRARELIKKGANVNSKDNTWAQTIKKNNLFPEIEPSYSDFLFVLFETL
jgi:hypothetical protein